MTWLKLILALLPTAIQAVEAILGPGNGAEKKAAVVATTSIVAAAAGATPEQGKAITDLAGAATDAIVAGYNATGVFKK